MNLMKIVVQTREFCPILERFYPKMQKNLHSQLSTFQLSTVYGMIFVFL
jgi:hypothetical protein